MRETLADNCTHGRYAELAGHADLSVVKGAMGQDAVVAEGMLTDGQVYNGQMHRRRFVFRAPAYISWPFPDEQVSGPVLLASK